MATVTWVGRQRKRAQVGTLTVGTASTGGTITVTVGGRKSVIVTPPSTDTAATAAAIAAACAASTEPEFREITWASSTNVVTFTGPADGAPITVAKTDGGSNSTTLVSSATAPLSPHDIGDGANYSTGSLPSGSDALVYENSSVDAKYNADALTGITLASVTRRASFTGRLGLARDNPAGYPEYRVSEVELDAPILYLEGANSDAAGQVRIKSVSSPAVTVTVTGQPNAAQLGSEAIEVRGLPSSSVLRATGGSIAVATGAGDTATVATLQAADATVRLGTGVTLTNATYTNCTVRQACSSTTLIVQEGGTVEVVQAAAVSNSGLKVYRGTVRWMSSGATGNSPELGPGGVVDFRNAPTSVTVGGTVSLSAGCGWLDPAGKIATSYSVQLNNCSLRDVTLEVGPDKTLAVS
jgi:hypothetical protein